MTRTLALWLTAMLAIFWAVAVVVSGSVIRHELDEAYDSALAETGARLAPLVVAQYRNGGAAVTTLADDRENQLIAYQLRGSDGAVLLRSAGAPADGFDVALRAGLATGSAYRVHTVQTDTPILFVQTASPLAERREAATEAAAALIYPLLLLVPASGLAVLAAVRRSLKPLAGLRAEMARRGSADLTPLPLGDVPRELVPIVSSMNRLLGRLREAIDAERSFAANSAHELRTPVAGALAQAQRLVADLPDGAPRERARLIVAAISRLGRLSEKLLQMARADSGLGTSDASQDILAVVRLVADELGRRPIYAERIRLAFREDDALVSTVDPDAAAIAIRNLLENALIHAPEDGIVHVDLTDSRTLVFRNPSPVIPKAVLDTLVSRFQRGPTTAAGSGLGLSIVSRLAASMGATLELRSRVDGEPVFEAILRFRSEVAAGA